MVSAFFIIASLFEFLALIKKSYRILKTGVANFLAFSLYFSNSAMLVEPNQSVSWALVAIV